jgi:hypothetical protein
MGKENFKVLENLKLIGEKIKSILENKTKCEFRLFAGTTIEGLPLRETPYVEITKAMKLFSENGPGIMFWNNYMWEVFIKAWDKKRRNQSKIKWPNDWIDPHPSSVDKITIYEDKVDITLDRDFCLNFMSDYYYGVEFIAFSKWAGPTITLKEREDRIKAARLTPAVIKDTEVFLKSLRGTLEKYGVKWTKPKIVNHRFLSIQNSNKEHQTDWSEVEHDYNGWVVFIFKTMNMNNEEIIDNVMKWENVLVEHRKIYRYEWLPSKERESYYKSTILLPEGVGRRRILKVPHRYLYKWPLKNENKELDWYVMELESGLSGCRLTNYKLCKCYNLEGYELRLVDSEIRVDEHKRLYLFPLEKIEFLKEDFPELWKS